MADSGAREIEIASERGAVRCALHSVEGAASAVVMVGGGDGGLDGPAEAIYPTLGEDLAELGITTLRVDFRIHQFPGDVEEGVADVLAGVRYLGELGVKRVGVLGHSFGGAVVIEAAAREAAIRSVVTLATQTAGAQRVGEIAPVPLLLVHGLDDVRLTPDCSRMLHRIAGEPKRLELLEGATHSLRQRREDVRTLVRGWFAETLRGGFESRSKFACLCCGYLTLDEEPGGTFDICSVCFWEDDNVQADDPDYAGGANKLSLNESRENFRRFGATEERFLKWVRPPLAWEYPLGRRGDGPTE